MSSGARTGSSASASAALQRFAAPSWNETAKHAWETAFNQAAGIMIDAAKDDAAVLTLQPEQPLAYLPGQHVSVQTPHWTPRPPRSCKSVRY